MKLTSVVLVFIAGIAAIAAGWIYQSKTGPGEAITELEIPVDIDYYLSGVKYRVMSSQGRLDYELRTPYLEHYKPSDTSRITAPQMDIFRNDRHWRASAQSAELQHQNNTLTMIDNVIFERSGDSPITMKARLLRFEADSNIVTGEEGVQIIGIGKRIHAETAIFDLDKDRYSLLKTRAVYD